MRTLFVVLAAGCWLAVQEVRAGLSREEISDGWIQLFDGETLFGWAPRGEAQWEAVGGEIRTPTGKGTGMLSTTTEFADFILHVEFWADAEANSGVFLRCPTEGEITGGTAIEVNICDAHPKWPTGSINEVAPSQGPHETVGKWNSFDIVAEGDSLTVHLNGTKVAEGRDSRFRRGTLALQRFYPQGELRFREVKLKPLGTRTLFNGQDLTGWTVLPDHPSVYRVTPEGWLNVKNGNGDLQTTEVFGDFILQLDIISNGQHLNSGVFFRALPGEFWSGYESQIRNQWEGEDRSKPVDFGTGGLYNHQPARRVVSSDGQWFTKTIVATGRHLAVWVDGIQVSDFVDRRDPNANARQGYRAEPGVISLQGHDPTTDLSFRNLRIEEFPPTR